MDRCGSTYSQRCHLLWYTFLTNWYLESDIKGPGICICFWKSKVVKNQARPQSQIFEFTIFYVVTDPPPQLLGGQFPPWPGGITTIEPQNKNVVIKTNQALGSGSQGIQSLEYLRWRVLEWNTRPIFLIFSGTKLQAKTVIYSYFPSIFFKF